jgi:hypothetical protein
MTKADRDALRREWAARIAEYKASGLSVSAWCKAHGLKPHRLWYWLRALKTEEASSQPCSEWLPVRIGAHRDNSVSSLVIRVGHAAIEVSSGFDQALFLDVVKALTSLC